LNLYAFKNFNICILLRTVYNTNDISIDFTFLHLLMKFYVTDSDTSLLGDKPSNKIRQARTISSSMYDNNKL